MLWPSVDDCRQHTCDGPDSVANSRPNFDDGLLARTVNGQVEVPGFGQVKVPTLCGLFRGSGAVLLDVGGLGACGRTGRW